MSIILNQGSLLDTEADFIVNPANQFLRHGAGVAKLIADAAAPKNAAGKRDEVARLWWNEQFTHPLIPTGAAAKTSAGHLPYKGIVHAVGPIWHGGDLHERSLLFAAHRNAIKVARDNGGESIAFPAISCGIFGYPVEQAAEVALGAAAYAAHAMTIEFWLYEDAHMEAYTRALAGLRKIGLPPR